MLQTIFTGAKNGLLLWFNTLLPSLLPFMILTQVIISRQWAARISGIFYPVLHRLFGLSRNGCFPFVIGLLSGYPVGAKTCADLKRQGLISREEGQFLLSLCNNASPPFILTFVAGQCLNLPAHAFALLLLMHLSVILASVILRVCSHKRGWYFPESVRSDRGPCVPFMTALDNAIMSSFEVITKVGGYVILFSIAVLLLKPFIPAAFLGILEITTGTAALSGVSLSAGLAFTAAAAVITFGGLSALAQTKSVLSGSGLSIRPYFLTKALAALLACGLSYGYALAFL
ncbi:transporter [Anaerolentibacter hominis]|uniref:transporter n=1 Tax=Anaerolentibacter hominis TaxID=3079009 RepID=UPI0031B85F5E